MDGPIKQITTDAAFATRHGLTSVNSINLGRVTVQAAHFFWSCAFTSCSCVCSFETDCSRSASAQQQIFKRSGKRLALRSETRSS